MTRRIVPFLFVALLTFSVLVVTPNAAAVTWAAAFDANISSGATAGVAVAHVSDGYAGAFYNGSAGNIATFRYTASGFAQAALESGGSGQSPIDLASVGDSLYICYKKSETADLKFARSVDAGEFWTTTGLYATGNAAKPCGIAASGSTVMIAFANGTYNAVQFIVSTDGGSSWTVPVNITTVASGGLVRLAASSSSTFLALFQSGPSLRSCRTTNAGSSWTCGALFATSGWAGTNEQLSLRFAGGTRWVAVYEASSLGGLTFIRSEDGFSWAAKIVDNSSNCSGLCDGNGGMKIAAANQTGYIVVYAHSGASSGGGTKLRYASSTDAGATWTRGDIDASSITYAAGLAVKPSGEALAVEKTNNPRLIGYKGSIFTTSLSSFASVAVTDLTGFDVDRSGSSVIARVRQGEKVQSFDATTLNPVSAGEIQTSCSPSGEHVTDTPDRVMAGPNLVAYVICDVADDTDPTYMEIRTSSLTDATFDCSYCPEHIKLNGFSPAGGDGIQQIGEIVEFPMNYCGLRADGKCTASRQAFAGGKQRVFAWAFSSNTGFIGVDLFTAGSAASAAQNGDNDNLKFTVESPYAADSPEQICAWENPDDGRQFIGAVDLASQSRVWEFVPHYDSGLDQREEGSLVFRTGYGGALSAGMGIACGHNRVAILSLGGGDLCVDVMGHLAGADGSLTEFYHNCDLANSVTRGVALSDDGKFLAYVNGVSGAGTIEIVNLATGNTTGSLTLPSGAFVGMKMDKFAQSLWVATNQSITRWSIYPVTTIKKAGTPNPDGGGPAGGAGSTTGLLGDAAEQFGASLGVGKFGAGLILGGMLVLAMVATGATAVRPAPTIGAAVGAVIGVLLGWGLGLLSPVAVFAATFLIVAGLGLRFYLARGA